MPLPLAAVYLTATSSSFHFWYCSLCSLKLVLVKSLRDCIFMREEETEESRLEDEMLRNIGVDIEQDTTNIFQNLLNEARNELYPDCSELSFLNFLVKLMNVKVLNGWSNKSFDMLLELLRAAFPMCSSIIPSFHFMKTNENFMSWAWDTRLFTMQDGSTNMRWHKDKRVETYDVLRHLADVKGWKHFDCEFPNFASDPRNIHLGLASNRLPSREINVYLQPLIEELKELWNFESGVQRGIREVPYAWVMDCCLRYEVEYPSWNTDAII
ncbi:uncharacterized protein E5676_scaffold313G00940 [Cucumis melo var. makuwa]|uniref:Uncharacterized protein n=1 Tax=Cucumis melo var. makuwa TaxID=1194695 RepID=A0A5D3DSI2_CUCMM|nr:uncharacterized protein E5676_scaffold313G00940 [Cucumis melo var. makuwa]